jgi:secreted PhoX family phosphatase
MSQDADSGYFFRFVAATNATDGTALDSGTLAVAQIEDSDIKWIDLGSDVPSLVGALGAAQSAGGSVFDAPGGISIGGDGRVYLACRGNAARSVDEVNALNPRAGDDNGHVLVFAAPNGDFTAGSFTGDLAIAAGDPASAQFTQYGDGSDCWFKNPRTLDIDPLGQLWIGTDQSGAVSGTADGLFIMQTGGPGKYMVSMAYLAPIGAAIGGAAFDANSRTAFGVVRHPGATPQASFEQPATRWPTLLANMPPQSTVIGLVGQG